MRTHDLLIGIGLAMWGAAFYAVAWWKVKDEARLRRMTQQRWEFDRRVYGALRRGEITADEWFTRSAERQRVLVRRVFPVFVALWFAACAYLIVSSL